MRLLSVSNIVVILWCLMCSAEATAIVLNEAHAYSRFGSTHCVLSFSSLPIVQFREITHENALQIDFHGITKNDFNTTRVTEALKTIPQELVLKIVIMEFSEGNGGVRLILFLDPEKAKLKISTYKDFSQVIIDVFSRKFLNACQQREDQSLTQC